MGPSPGLPGAATAADASVGLSVILKRPLCMNVKRYPLIIEQTGTGYFAGPQSSVDYVEVAA